MHKGRLIANVVIVSLILSFIVVDAEGDDDRDAHFTESSLILGNKYQNYTEEGDSTTWDDEIDVDGIASFELSLTWKDEDDSSNHENQPDRFEFSVETPWGETYDSDAESNQHGQEHTIFLNVNVTDVNKDGTDKAQTSGAYSFAVHCIEAGDQDYTGFPGLGSDENDDGNDWEFAIRYSLWQKD